MRTILVKFKNYYKEYAYQTNLSLIEGGEYKIVADHEQTYENPVIILDNDFKGNIPSKLSLRTITSATSITAPPVKRPGIYKVVFNEAKRTTIVIWTDGQKTKLTCAADEAFDREKAIALAFMKHEFGNRGAFNNVLRDLIDSAIEN